MRKTVLAAALAAALLPALPAQVSAQPASLPRGEYMRVGSGGQILIGLGFKVTGPGRYTDLDGGSPGAFTISDGRIHFRGGHLDGEEGVFQRGGGFTIHSASCSGPA